jgi:(p)ppGpp synthase/HD superfamily hydrolase
MKTTNDSNCHNYTPNCYSGICGCCGKTHPLNWDNFAKDFNTAIRIEKIKQFAIYNHEQTNHKYDTDKPYSVHLQMVVDYCLKYSNLIPDNKQLETVICACWCHDLIEDTRLTYNDVKEATSTEIAEIVYALTNEKGKNRKERANEKYYEGIRQNRLAVFVKLCDRLANIKYSVDNKSRMSEAYKKEYNDFKYWLWSSKYDAMFEEMEEFLNIS